MDKPEQSSIATDVIAGLAVFFSMSYVAFANPILLSQAGHDNTGMPAGPVFFATCLMAALASILSGAFAHSPAALAPGLALSGAIYQFLRFKETTISWESALAVCGFAGLCLLWASLSNFRRRVVDSIPPSITLAVTGGIGAVLADNAIRLVREHPGHPTANSLLFAAGLALIVLGYFGLRSLSNHTAVPRGLGRALDLLGRSALFLSVPVVAIAAHLTLATPMTKVDPTGSMWIWNHTTLTAQEVVTGAFKWEALSLLFFVLYILFADIVGSPYHMALDDRSYTHGRSFTPQEEKVIKRSFIVDSLANILAPIAGSSPIVYYAENFAGKVLGGRTALVAYVTAFGFLALFTVGLLLAQQGRSIAQLIPGISVAPALFFVGLIIVSKALWPDSGTVLQEEPEAPRAPPQHHNPLIAEFQDLGKRLPAAISIVVTPLAGFEIGVAAGILSYFLFDLIIPDGYFGRGVKEDSSLGWLALIASVSVFIKIKLLLGG